MMFDLPPDDALYDALIARDAGYDGRAFVGVTSTGIFCRLTCPARKPKRENCKFYGNVGACIEAGFRPCKRCHPLGAAALSDPTVTTLVAALDARPDKRWSEADIIALGLDPSTARRAFQRHFGQTFLSLARQRRIASGLTTLTQGGRIIDAQIDAGYDSPSAFRRAFARMTGIAPGAFSKDALLWVDWLATPLGPMIAIADNHALHLLEFVDRKGLPREVQRLFTATKGRIGFGRTALIDQLTAELGCYFAGQDAHFRTPLAYHGSPFTQAVWDALRRIPAGQMCSYSALARSMGRPSSVRAVARANGANQIAILIPCHRVIGADGALTGYGGGLWRKQSLIDLERSYATKPHTQGASL